MPSHRRADLAAARFGQRVASRLAARGWAGLLALLLALQGVAWATHAASHAVPTSACVAGAIADEGSDAHCSGGACVTCHALSLFDGAPPAGQPPVALAAVHVAATEVASPWLPRRALPWAQSRAPPVPA